MKVKQRFTITEFHNRSGSISYRVAGRKLDGTRIRRNFDTQDEAIGEQSRLELEASNNSIERVPRITSLQSSELIEAEAAFKMLGDRSLLEAVNFYLKNYREPIKKISLQEAFEVFMLDKESSNCRPLTLQNLKARVGGFVRLHPDHDVSDVSAALLKTYIFKPSLKPSTRDNHRRALSSFFSWAERSGFCKPSPMREIPSIHVDREEPTILSLSQIKTLLEAAQEYRKGALIPYITLGLFAAIRPNEITGLKWDNIDLEEGLITISSATSKMRQRRLVEVSDNLITWLAPHALKAAPIVPKNFRRDFDTIKALAGFEFVPSRVNFTAVKEAFSDLDTDKLSARPKWTPDVLRHTAISYHLSRDQHEGKTATWAGNSPDIIQKHYKGLVRPKDSAAFWRI